MKKRAFNQAPFVLVLVLPLAVIAQDRGVDTQREDVVDTFSDRIRDGNAESFYTNGFRIESTRATELGADLRRSETEFQLVSVDSAHTFRIAIEKGRPMSAGGGLAVFHRESGRPMLAVSDSDDDGALDLIEYSKVDGNGNVLLTVIDYEADGQADLRLNFAERSNQIWHIDRWYDIETRNDQQGIVIGSEFVELRRENNRLLVP